MRWITRAHIHFDRVVASWLIKRFVDKDAVFEFLYPNHERPADATPYGMAGVELSDPSDERGTTFHKIIEKYGLRDPVLEAMDDVVTKGVTYIRKAARPTAGDLHGDIALGLASLAEGILLLSKSDHDTIERSMILYDGLYAVLQARALLKARGEEEPRGMGPGMWQTMFVMALTMHLRPQDKVLGPGTTATLGADFDQLIGGMRKRGA